MEPRDAATVMLVRDAHTGGRDAGLEVFMLRRNLRSAFVAGAYVFPGGAVDDVDRADATFALVDGIDDPTASARLGRAPGALAFWVAAIREAFEEAGVVLARERATGKAASAGVAAALAPARAPVAAGERSFVRLLADAGLVLDGGALRAFGRWITPPVAPRRYDTWFFVAPAPAGHAYVHDDDETVASEWVRPDEALARGRRDEIELIYPTYRTLQALAQFKSCADLLAAVDAAWRDPATAMRDVHGTRAWQVRLPGDGDGDADAALEADARANSVRTARAAGAGRRGRRAPVETPLAASTDGAGAGRRGRRAPVETPLATSTDGAG